MLRRSSSRGESWSPLATVEEIQKRLLRPSSNSRNDEPLEDEPERSDDPSHLQVSLKLKEAEMIIRSKGESKNRSEAMKKELEDYLDPVLLSEIRLRVMKERSSGDHDQVMQLRSLGENFEWPADEDLKPFMELEAESSSRISTVKRRKLISDNEDGVVNLNDDVDCGDIGEEEEENEQGGGYYSPFRQLRKLR